MSKKLKTLNPYFLLSGILLFSCLIVYVDFLFGNKFFLFQDIGSDTKCQYLMWYSSIADKIRAGTFSFWDFKNGFGANISMEGIYDPFQWIICLFGAAFGSSRIPYILVYVNILKIVLSGLTAYFFLNCFSLSKNSKIILSYIYAFNGFIIVWGQHYFFATIVVYLPLLFASVEKTLHHKKFWIAVTASTCLIGIYSIYFCYMSLATAGVYYVIRLLQMDKPLPEKGRIFARETLSILLGLGLACFSLLPVAHLILNVSPRTANDSSLWTRLISSLAPFPKEYYTTLIYRMFSSNLQRTLYYAGYLNYYEALNFCCSNLLIFLLIQHVFFTFKKSVPRKGKIIQALILFLLVFAFLLPTGGLIYNAFIYTMCRWSFTVIPILILLSAKALDHILLTRKLSMAGVGLYGILITVVYGKAFRNLSAAGEEVLKLNTVILFVTGCMVALGLYLFVKRKISPQAVSVFLLGIVCLNLISDSYVSANHRDAIRKDGTYIADVYNQDVEQAVRDVKQKNDDFFRMEKTFVSGTINMLDPLAQNYYGVNTYNSVINQNTLTFNEKIWKNLQANIYFYQCFNNAKQDHILASLVGMRYIMSNDKQEQLNGFTKYAEFGDIAVYENTYDVALGRLYTKSITEQQFEETEYNVDNLLTDAVILEKESQFAASPSDLKAYQDSQPNEQLFNAFQNQELADFKVTSSDSHLAGGIDASQDGILFLSIPYEGGWEVRVDGAPVEKLKADYGFTAIQIHAGQHEITLDFTPPWQKSGIIISVTSLLLIAGFVIIQKKRERSRGKND